MKKIAFIARGLTKNGVRSFIETKLSMSNAGQDIQYLLFTDEKKYKMQFPNLKVIYIKNFNKVVWDYLLLPIYLFIYKIEEVIYTKNIIPFTHALFKWKKINYVLDLAFKYKELKAYRPIDSFYMNTFLGLSLKKADEVWAISKFTKEEIIKFYPRTNSKKIKITNLPINNVFKKIKNKKQIELVKKKYNLADKFIFYCGSISPRKNILKLLKAFNKIDKDIPHYLYLVSSRSWLSDKVFKYLKEHSNMKVRLIKDVADSELAVFYSIADLFVYPSLYEGFGLPIKEAEACECKVLTSNFGAMKEVANKNAILVDTKTVSELAKGIKKALR